MTSETTPGLRCAVRPGAAACRLVASTPRATSLTFPYRLHPRAVYGLQPQVYFLAHLLDIMARARLVTPLSLNVSCRAMVHRPRELCLLQEDRVRPCRSRLTGLQG